MRKVGATGCFGIHHDKRMNAKPDHWGNGALSTVGIDMCLGSYFRGCLDQLVNLLPAPVSCKMEGSSGRTKESLRGPGREDSGRTGTEEERTFFSLSSLALKADLFPKKWV